MNTANPRTWLIGGVVAAVLLALLGWVFVINPRMQTVATTKQETIALDDQAVLLTAQANQLKAQAKELPAQIVALRQIQKRIPAAVNVPALLRQIERSAKRNDVDLQSLSPGQITTFSAADTGATTSADPAATASPNAAAPAPAPSPTTGGQGRLPKGMTLSYVPVAMTATGEFGDLERFIAEVENLQRAYLVTGMELTRSSQSAEAGNPLSLTLDTRVFVSNDRLRDLPDEAVRRLQEAQ